MKKRRKAQVWYIDYILASFIFVVGLALYFEVSSNLTRETVPGINSMVMEADAIGSSLLAEGYPQNWTEDNVKRVGILTNKRIDLIKYAESGRIEYETLRYLFGTSHDFFVFFEKKGEVIYLAKQCGIGSKQINTSPNMTDSIAYYRRNNNSTLSSYLNGVPFDIYGENNLSILIENLGRIPKRYPLVILEDAHLGKNAENNISRFMGKGGTIIASGQMFSDNQSLALGLNISEANCSNSIVEEEHPFMNTSTGEQVNFGKCLAIRSSEKNSVMGIANSTANSYTIAYITNGIGELYYFSDFNGTAGTTRIEKIVDEVAQNYITGTCSSINAADIRADNLVSSVRFVPYKNKILRMTVYVWS